MRLVRPSGEGGGVRVGVGGAGRGVSACSRVFVCLLVCVYGYEWGCLLLYFRAFVCMCMCFYVCVCFFCVYVCFFLCACVMCLRVLGYSRCRYILCTSLLRTEHDMICISCVSRCGIVLVCLSVL